MSNGLGFLQMTTPEIISIVVATATVIFLGYKIYTEIFEND